MISLQLPEGSLNPFPESRMLIRFADCDPLNHLNNGRYIDYFMNAREDHLLAHYGLTTFQLAQQTGRTWVVAQNQIAYLKPAWLMEQVVIRSVLRYAGEKSALIEMIMFDEQQESVKAVLWTHLAYFDIRGKRPVAHEPEVMDFFKRLEVPFEAPVSFDARVKALRQGDLAAV